MGSRLARYQCQLTRDASVAGIELAVLRNAGSRFTSPVVLTEGRRTLRKGHHDEHGQKDLEGHQRQWVNGRAFVARFL